MRSSKYPALIAFIRSELENYHTKYSIIIDDMVIPNLGVTGVDKLRVHIYFGNTACVSFKFTISDSSSLLKLSQSTSSSLKVELIAEERSNYLSYMLQKPTIPLRITFSKASNTWEQCEDDDRGKHARQGEVVAECNSNVDVKALRERLIDSLHVEMVAGGKMDKTKQTSEVTRDELTVSPVLLHNGLSNERRVAGQLTLSYRLNVCTALDSDIDASSLPSSHLLVSKSLLTIYDHST